MVEHWTLNPGVEGSNPFGVIKNNIMNFNQKCYELLKKVPSGKITTYKALAEALDTRAYQAVGNAMNKNPHGFDSGGDVPCHRVINTNGDLGGFAHGKARKIKLMEKEGIKIQHEKIDLKKYQYLFK